MYLKGDGSVTQWHVKFSTVCQLKVPLKVSDSSAKHVEHKRNSYFHARCMRLYEIINYKRRITYLNTSQRPKESRVQNFISGFWSVP